MLNSKNSIQTCEKWNQHPRTLDVGKADDAAPRMANSKSEMIKEGVGDFPWSTFVIFIISFRTCSYSFCDLFVINT